MDPRLRGDDEEGAKAQPQVPVRDHRTVFVNQFIPDTSARRRG